MLVVTNGHGEDQLAVCLIEGLRAEWPELEIEAIPLVGRGDRLAAAGVAVPGPRVIMPSGGMVRPEPATVWKDLRAGLLRKFWRQRAFVRSRKDKVQRLLAVGDVLAGWTAGGALPHLSLMLVATAKSEYISGHGVVETRWMRRRTEHVFARDERTAAALRDVGVDASWVGNLMMDAFDVAGYSFLSEGLQGDDGERRPIGLFPGSREDAYVNLRHLADVLVYLEDSGSDGQSVRPQDDGRYVGIVPLAPGLDPEKAGARLREDGWRPETPRRVVAASNETRDGADGPSGVPVHPWRRGAATVLLVEGAFGDVLVQSELVIGLAGTANEQAAGLGKPVVAFPGPGVQFGGRFLRAQKRLLGDALAVTDPHPAAVAREVERIFVDDALRTRMASVGRERMGPPGAARRMAAAIAQRWRTNRSR